MARLVDERTQQLQAPSTALVTKHAEDPKQDIANERKRASFSSQELCYFLNGGKEKVERRAQFAEVLSKTSWASKEQQYFHTREEEYVHNLRCSLGIWQKITSEKLTMDDGLMMRTLADSPGGLELHIGMFMPTIMSQGDAEQQAKWLPPCLSLQIIGTYAQTELGHGTFVRGLETTATYDPATQVWHIRVRRWRGHFAQCVAGLCFCGSSVCEVCVQACLWYWLALGEGYRSGQVLLLEEGLSGLASLLTPTDLRAGTLLKCKYHLLTPTSAADHIARSSSCTRQR
eukprot:GHRQ01035300.1.p1 GENE.GHRQ01035300.1~~GHRQ01035300.1.p1  ORF type:complete len:287 (+),score=92.20 GHRQ01035300.1:159-1019(+)